MFTALESVEKRLNLLMETYTGVIPFVCGRLKRRKEHTGYQQLGQEIENEERDARRGVTRVRKMDQKSGISGVRVGIKALILNSMKNIAIMFSSMAANRNASTAVSAKHRVQAMGFPGVREVASMRVLDRNI